MGLNLSLNLTPTIDAKQWDRFWHDSLELLYECPARLVRASKRKTPYGSLDIWTDNLTAENKDGEYWEIQGDAESLSFAEPVRLYRDLNYYLKKWNKIAPEKRPPNDDPLYCTAKDFEDDDYDVPLGGLVIFNRKTQGYPYHHAVAGVALLAEHRFPLKALAWGDLRPVGCNVVRHWLSTVFEDEEFLMPTCLDAARLWNRIEGVCGDAPTTMKRFEERFLGTREQEIQRMLAESREATMQKIAENLSHYEGGTVGFRDISKSFLEATNDLDMLFELIDLRNSIASKEKDASIITNKDILVMLARGHVTYTQYQGEELRTFNRWMGLEGNIIQTINTTFMRMSMPVVFNYYCSEADLIEAFARREPEKREKFQRILRNTLEDNQRTEEMIKDLVHAMKRKAEEVLGPEPERTGDEEPDFYQFMNDEVYSQSEMQEPMTKKTVAMLGQVFGYATQQMLKTMDDIDGIDKKEVAESFKDPTGNKQRAAIFLILKHKDVMITKAAMKKLEQTTDVDLLNFFVLISPYLFTDMFETPRQDGFGQAFAKAKTPLWHILNKPRWWKILSEHLHDGVDDLKKNMPNEDDYDDDYE